MLTLSVLRHGETVWNREERFQGWRDSPLTEAGEAQVRARAVLLNGDAPYDVLVSSDLGRARQTAAILGEVLHLPLAGAYPEFRESNLGVLEGRTLAELRAILPDYFDADGQLLRPDVRALPASEPQAAVHVRTRSGLQKLLAAYPDQRVLLAAHAGTQRALCAVLDVPPPVDVGDPASILTFAVDADAVSLA